MSNQDRDKWNARYAQIARPQPVPPQALLDNIHQLRPGKLLDVACGEGAVALYLAARGDCQVTAVDISEIGLARLVAAAASELLKIETVQADLDDWISLDVYDCITIFSYKPTKGLLRRLVDALRPDGRLLISTFNQRHHQANGFSSRFCLAHNELLGCDKRLQLIDLQHSVSSPYTDTYIFQKRH